MANMGFVPQQLISYFDTILERYGLLLVPICLLPVFILLWAERKHQRQLRTTPRGCRKLGLQGSSNLADEDAAKYSKATPESWKIKALFIHPIKSCSPVEVDVADVTSTGLIWDRQFCFAEWTKPMFFPPGFPESEKKKKRWTFRSLRQKGYQKLVKVRPEIWVPDPECVRINRISDPNLDGVLVINYPNLPGEGISPFKRRLFEKAQSLGLIPKESSFHVPLLPPRNHSYPLEEISIWNDMPFALNYGCHVPQRFKSYLSIPESTPFTLFRISPTHLREIHHNAPKVPYQPVTAFADSQPLHLMNLASVRDVAEKVRKEIPFLTARRFRPNIIITGPKAYDEDEWKKIRIRPKQHDTMTTQKFKPERDSREETEFFTACHTIRCTLPNVDPDTAIKHGTEPDRTLKSFRCIDQGDSKNAALGLQIVPAKAADAAEMSLQVGDEIEVLERGELVYVKR